MSIAERNDNAAVIAALLERLLMERQRGSIRPLAEYLAEFPGFETLIAVEYARSLQQEPSAGAETEHGSVDSRRIGRYRLLAELGRGGQGVVYLAEDDRLGRKVALKVNHFTLGTDEKAFARLQREAAIVSRLDHPAICRVYDVGRDGSVFWIAMHYVEGETLAHRIATAKSDGRASHVTIDRASDASIAAAEPGSRAALLELIALFERLAHGLHEAHEDGVVHRDIKPGNIMITAKGEPVLLDFGLARDDQSQSAALTRSGDRFGTPAYMSPEQLSGATSGVDRRTDIWSLGVSLYEALVLRRPFEGQSSEVVQRLILSSEPVSARRWNQRVPRDLATVLQTALAKDPHGRYQTALDFAGDLARVRRGEPIAARPIGPARRLWRWTRRYPLAASLLALLALALASALILLDRVRGGERHSHALALAGSALTAIETDPQLALSLALRAVEVERKVETISALHQVLGEQRQVRKLAHPGALRTLVSSADGSRLLSASDSRFARLAFLREERAPVDFAHEGEVVSAVFSPNEEQVLTASVDGAAVIWSLDGTERVRFRHPEKEGVVSAIFSPDGLHVLTGCTDGYARVWRASGGEPLKLETRRLGPVQALFTSGGECVLTWASTYSSANAIEDRTAHLHWASGKFIADLQHDHQLLSVASAPAGDLLATISEDRAVRLWDARTGELLRPLLEHPNDVISCAFAPDGQRLVTTCADKSARIWSRAGDLLHELKGHSDAVCAATFSADGQLVATTSLDQHPRVWDLEGNEFAVCYGHLDRYARSPVVFLPGPVAPRLATGADDGWIRIWEVWNLDGVPWLGGSHLQIISGTFSGNGQRVVTGYRDGTVRVWDASGRPLRDPFVAHGEGTFGIRLSTDGSRLLTMGGDRTARVWDLDRQDRPIHEFALAGLLPSIDLLSDGSRVLLACGGEPARICELSTDREILLGDSTAAYGAFARGGQVALTVDDAGTTRLWSLEGDLLPSPPAGHEGRVWNADLDADGQLVVSGGEDGRILVWDRRRESQRTLVQGGSGVFFVRLSPRGDRIVSSHFDRAARVWDLQGNLLAVLRGHAGKPWIDFLPDGSRFVTVSGGVRVWFAYEEDLLEAARARDRLELSIEEVERCFAEGARPARNSSN